MPMLDIQRRHADVFRIRLGHQVPSKNGKQRPEKLTDQIRVTARTREIVQAFVDVYGGEVTEWEKQWQAYLPTDSLNVMVLPGQSLTQWWERYRGSVCQRRCDGYLEQKSGKKCVCPEDIEERLADDNACVPTTRVNVLCPDVAVVGSGALVTHSMIAAETLPQAISVAEAALTRGWMVPARLRVVEHRGRNHFIVPQLEIVGVSLNELVAGNTPNGGAHALATPLSELEGAPSGTPAGAFTPVPAISAPSVAEQVADADDPTARPPRSNAAEPIKPTGLRPRQVSGAGSSVEGASSDTAGGTTSPPTGDDPDRQARAQQIAMRCADAGITTDEDRHAFITWITDGAATNGHEVEAGEQLAEVMAAIVRYGRGELEWSPGGVEGGSDDREVSEADDQPSKPSLVSTGTALDGAGWRAACAEVPGIGPGKLVKAARELAVEAGVDPPRDIDHIPAELTALLRAWLDEQGGA